MLIVFFNVTRRSVLLQRKALYNLIQLNLTRIETGELQVGNLKKWQISNYRALPPEDLFAQLRELNIDLDLMRFEELSQNFEAPEEMVEKLASNREPLEKDQIFLIFFELWRRIWPEKRTISIFCDELDHQMIAYDLGRPSEITDALAYLQQLLEEHADRGLDPHHCFQLVQTYCANDIESFLFDFTLNEIETDNYSYAIELLDGFKPFLKPSLWFDYLRARACILKDPEDGYEMLEIVIHKITQETPLDLVADILFFLANSGNHSLFYTLAKKTMPLLKSERDFQEFLEACYSHYDYLELKKPALAIAHLFYSRRGIPSHTPLAETDPGMEEMRVILDQRLHFAEE